MGAKATYFKNASQICDFISVVSAIFLLISTAGGIIFIMVPAAAVTAISVIISMVTHIIYKRYEKINE